MKEQVYWCGTIEAKDDFGAPIGSRFVDGKTRHGPWAIMSVSSWMFEGCGKLGPGYGQQYDKQPDGRWLKTKG